MKPLKMIVQLFVTVGLLACCKEPVNPPKPPAAKQLEVVWKTPLIPQNATSSTLGMTPVLYGNEVIFNTEFGPNGAGETVLFLDTANGNITRTWSDLSGTIYTLEKVVLSGDYLLFGEQSDVDCLNLVSATTQWSGTVTDERPHLYEHQGYIYRGFRYDYENGQYNSCRLKRTPAGSNAWETVYDFTRTDNYRPGFIGCGFGTLPNCDEVVVWKNWSLTPGNSERTDIFAYNLTADSLIWRNTDFKEGATVQPLKIVNGVVYGLIRKGAIAIDLVTGATLWQQDFSGQQTTFPQSFAVSSDFHIHSSYVFVKGQSDELFILRKNNGTVWKVIQDSPDIYDKYTYFEGKLWGAGDGISAIDLSTGEDLLKDYKQIHDNSWRSSITIDPLRRVMYCHDGVYAYCIKIPDL
jgi:hypothetical protein